MIKANERVFVDTGAWIAASVPDDVHHAEATAALQELLARGARLVTSVSIVIETFTYLQRRHSLAAAAVWRAELMKTPRLEILDCTAADLESAWPWLERRKLHKLGIVDATSFALMKKHKLKRAFGFDVHFVRAGFQLIHL